MQQRRFAGRHVGVDQHRQKPKQAKQHAEGRQQRLRVKEIAQHAEKAEEKHYERITPSAQFKRFKCEQHDQQSYPGIASEKRAVSQKGGRNRERKQAEQPPAARQRP